MTNYEKLRSMNYNDIVAFMTTKFNQKADAIKEWLNSPFPLYSVVTNREALKLTTLDEMTYVIKPITGIRCNIMCPHADEHGKCTDSLRTQCKDTLYYNNALYNWLERESEEL